MLKQILSVISARYAVAAANLLLILINAKTLGTDGLGIIALIWASININITVCSIFSGNTLVYFMNRYSAALLYPISFVWIIAGSGLGTIVMHFIGIIPSGYAVHVYFLTILYAIPLAHSRFLLARSSITGFNITNLLQGILLLPVLYIIYIYAGMKDTGGYILALYISSSTALAASSAMLIPHLYSSEKKKGADRWPVIRDMFIYGIWSSMDNIAENLTTRLNYFLVELHLGRSAVGILDAATKISESVWQVSRSIAHIQYSRIAGSADPVEQRTLTRRSMKYALAALLGMTVIVVAIPEYIYTEYLFTPSFAGLRKIICILSPGIIALGMNTIFSHYFIGSGRIKCSAISSLTGLAVIFTAGAILIPAYKLSGSAMSSVLAYTAMLAVSAVMYGRRES
jgi:O-antigen/teichoic acid export membrane protein